MELFIYLFLIGLALYLAYLLLIYVILPVASVAGILTLVVSALYALIVSLKSFFDALIENINPYVTYVDKHANVVGNIKRNYFFGPGLHQVKEIIGDAFYNLDDYAKRLSAWKQRALTYKWYLDIFIYVGYFFAVFNAKVLGFVWTAAFSILLTVIILVGMSIFFIFFTALWLLDRLVLLLKSIHNRCPNCKRKSVIPVFVCPTCGMEHKKLVPGPYGVFKRKCPCGTKLSTTFIGGRSKYEAHCPYCGRELFSSSSQQYGIQLVGGSGTGKTTYMAAFWHEYKNILDRDHTVSYKQIPEEAFEELEEWYQSGRSEATSETNANMYSIIHDIEGKTPVQMTIYDIAGEVFQSLDSETQQQQYKYCEGFIVMIDPTANPNYVSESVIKFVNLMDEIKGKHSSKATSVPVAVVISKSDLYKTELGRLHVRSTYKRATQTNPELTYEQHRNDVYRDFLLRKGYENALNLLESAFTNRSFFAVSAMGHGANQGSYVPWGVLDPVIWLMKKDNCPLKAFISKSL